MLLWSPVNGDNKPVFFTLAAMWGVSDAVWQTQINALYGVLFINNQEAGFANYRLWESLGFIVAFIYADLISVKAKTLILFGVLGAGMAGEKCDCMNLHVCFKKNSIIICGVGNIKVLGNLCQ